MPATLGHIGVQYLLTRGVIRGADVKWILLGCVLADLPWIAQRITLATTEISPITTRLYAIGQSSLAVSLLACAALAMFSRRTGQVFAILALGTILHLLLDATQIKWGNGVVLWAPFHWNTTRFDWFWPEDLPSLILLGLGAAIAGWLVVRAPGDNDDLRWPGLLGWGAAALCLGAYVLTPVATMDAVARANLHFTATVSEPQTRMGHPIEIDRNRLTWVGDEAQLTAWFGETLRLTGTPPGLDGRISLKGQFDTPDQILVREFHVHRPGLRNYASLAGLLFVLLWWGRVFWRLRLRINL